MPLPRLLARLRPLPSRDRVAELARRYGWAIGTPFANLTAAVLLNVVVTRLLGPAGYGHFIAVTTLVSLLVLPIGLSIGPAFVRRGAAAASADGGPEAMATMRAAAWAVVLGLAAVALLLVAVVLLLGDAPFARLTGPFRHGTGFGVTLLIAVLAAVGAVWNELAAATAQAAMDFRRYFLTVCSYHGGRVLALGLVAVTIGLTPTRALWATTLAALAVGGLAAGRGAGAAWPRWRRARAAVRIRAHFLLRAAVPMALTGIVIAATTTIDTLWVAARLPAADVGFYGAATRLIVIQGALIAGMTTIALPMAARATDAAACRGYLQRMTRLGVLAGGAGTAGLLLAAPIAIHLLYGGAFQPAVLAFSVLALGLVPNFWGNLTAQLLYTTGHTRVLFGIHLVQLGIMLVCLGPAINAGGLLGAAVVRAATNAGAALAADAMARRIVGQMERAASSASVAIEGS